MNHAALQMWLDRYVQAWLTYDAQQIGDLFSEDAEYYYSPYDAPVKGRAAIVENWLENRDASGRYTATYHPVAVEGNIAIANGRSTYFKADGKTVEREFDNIFRLRFDTDGRCSEFTEWYMQKPKG